MKAILIIQLTDIDGWSAYLNQTFIFDSVSMKSLLSISNKTGFKMN